MPTNTEEITELADYHFATVILLMDSGNGHRYVLKR